MKKLAVLSAFICICTVSFAQEMSYSDAEKKISDWMLSNTRSDAPVPGMKSSTVNFPSHGYSIEGLFIKGALASGQDVVIYNTQGDPEPILKGKVSYVADRLVVTGVKYDGKVKDGTCAYGSFYVSNTPTLQMVYKDKKSDELSIRPKEISYYCGHFLSWPTTVSTGCDSRIYVDGISGGRGFAYFTAKLQNEVPVDADRCDMFECLMSTSTDAYMYWSDDKYFTGKVRPVLNEDGSIRFDLLQGKTVYFGEMQEIQEIHEVRTDDIYTVLRISSENPESTVECEEFYVRNELFIESESYWDHSVFYDNCEKIVFKYRNGDTYSGMANVKHTLMDDESKAFLTIDYTYGLYSRANGEKFEGYFKNGKFSRGTFTYLNGDKFHGNLEGKLCGPFFVEGTTYFSDGTQYEGNWLNGFSLNSDQWDQVYSKSNPSEARAIAKQMTYSNLFIEYTSKTRHLVYYFNPETERRDYVFCGYILYDKEDDVYECLYNEEDEQVEVEIQVDDSGKHLMEIVYKKGVPMYINVLAWYSNGSIESIESYRYDTQQIYLICNFFSDGTIRSAYQYGIGNSGENILRKSKEAHPTYGGYTSRLYDLNGKYERTVNWEIGEEKSYGLFSIERIELAPLPLNLSEYTVKP